jgi:hypothetical protein
MRLFDAYYNAISNNNPSILKKRILSVARSEIVHCDDRIYTMFAVCGLRILAIVFKSNNDNPNEVAIYPMENYTVYDNDSIYWARYVSFTSSGLIAVISDWLNLVVPEKDRTYYSNLKKWVELYSVARFRYDTNCSSIWVEPQYHKLRP